MAERGSACKVELCSTDAVLGRVGSGCGAARVNYSSQARFEPGSDRGRPGTGAGARTAEGIDELIKAVAAGAKDFRKPLGPQDDTTVLAISRSGG